ncbi:unnamed protein product [Closterium sp. NIES-53]
MKDAERLNLLKEIGGARVYEERRKESLKIMQEAEVRRQQIADFLAHIEARLKELDEEKEELKRFQLLDKQRRSLEYAIFEKELAEARDQLENVESRRQQVQERTSGTHQKARERQEEVKEVERQLKAKNRELQGLVQEQERVEEQRNEGMRACTRLRLDVKELEQALEADQGRKQELEAELQQLQRDIAKSNADLEAIHPQHQQHVAEENALNKRLAECSRRLDALYERKGQKAQFKSKDERDRWLRRGIAELEQLVQRSAAQVGGWVDGREGGRRRKGKFVADVACKVQGLEAESERLRQAGQQLQEEMEQKGQQVGEAEAEVARCAEEMRGAKARRDEQNSRRKQLMKQEADLAAEVKRMSEEKDRAEGQLDKSTPRVSDGGGGRAREKGTEERQGGQGRRVGKGGSGGMGGRRWVGNRRTDHILLNQARALTVAYLERQDVVPLLSKVKYEPQIASVCGQVFGRAVVCRDLSVAADVARSGSFDCITLEGSQVERKGAMTGGHYDPRRSRLRLMQTVRESNKRVRELQQELRQAVAVALGDLERLEAKQRHLASLLEQTRADMRGLKGQLAANQAACEQKEEAVGKLRASVEEQQAAAEAKRGEIGTALVAGLSAGEQAEVEALVPEIDSVKQQLLACKRTRLEVESRMSQLETALTENLLRRQDEVQAEVDVVHVASRRSELEGRRAEVAAADNALQELVQEHKRVGSRMEQLMKEIRELKASKDKLKQQEEEWERAVQDEGKALEQLLNQRSVWQHKRDEASKKIRDLGSLPADAFDKYQKQSMWELHQCNEEVQGFGHVNQQSAGPVDAPVRSKPPSLSHSAPSLLHVCVPLVPPPPSPCPPTSSPLSPLVPHHRYQKQSVRELHRLLHHTVLELIGVLDQRKDEALERTFKQVARNFRETFAQLVRSGHGSLVMVRKRKEDEAVDEDEDDEEGGGGRDGDADSRLDKYAGVRVKVCARSPPLASSPPLPALSQGETQEMRQLSGGQETVVALALIFAPFCQGETQAMRQLSGGQKTVVALALIFAIQQCDPAPFYLFDEIDAALDPQYRAAVGSMIRKQADESGTQFVITTFRPELVKVADRVYGVFHKNRVSTVKVIDQHAALAFIEHDQGGPTE